MPDDGNRLDALEARLANLETLMIERVLPALDRLPPPLPLPRPAPLPLPRPAPLPTTVAPRAPAPAVPSASPAPTSVAAIVPPPVPVAPAPTSVAAVAPPPVPVPVPVAPATAADGATAGGRPLARRAPASGHRDLEKFVGVSVLGRVGVAALLLAAGYFAQWGYVRVPPVARVAAIYGLAGVLLAAGALLRRRVSTLYVGILWGGATAAAYLAGAAAKLRYDLVGPEVATAMLVGACVLGDVLARRAKVAVLALVAIAGAAAAPLLVGEHRDARTTLLVYLLVVHAWSAWVASRRGWPAARLVGLASTAFVAVGWALAWGGHDLSTFTHLELYLLGFTLPEWGSAIVRGPVSAPRAHAVFVVAFVANLALGLASMAGRDDLARGFAAATGGVWILLAALARLRVSAPDALVRGLTRVGGTLLVIAAVAWFQSCAAEAFLRQAGPLLALTAVALVALAGRRFFGAGDGIAIAAAAVAIFGTAVRGFDPGLSWRAVAVVAPLALLLVGRSSAARVTGAALAFAACLAALTPRTWDEPWGIALAVFAIAPILLLALERARRGRDGPLAATGAILLGLLGAAWALVALGSPWSPVVPALGNAPTVAGCVILLAAAAYVGRDRPAIAGASARGLLGAGALTVLLAGLWREVHASTTAAHLEDVGRVLETGGFAAVALLAFVVGQARRRVALDVGGGIAWAVAAVHALATIGWPGGAWTAAAQIGFVALPAAFVVPRRGGAPTAMGVLAGVGLGVAVVLWFMAGASGRFAGEALVGNGRCVSGAVLVAAIAWVRGRVGGLRTTLGVASVLLSVFVAIPEVLEATKSIESVATRRALLSVYGALHASAVLGIGFLRREAALRWLALGGFGVVVAKVAFFDLADVSTPIRVLVTGCLGAILLAAAYAYARRSRDASTTIDP